IDLPDLDFVDAELPCGPVEERLEHRRALHPTGPALRAARRRVGSDRKAAEPERHRLIEKRRDHCRDLVVALTLVRTAVLDDEEIHRRDAAVLAEANLHARLESWPHAANVGFLF